MLAPPDQMRAGPPRAGVARRAVLRAVLRGAGAAALALAAPAVARAETPTDAGPIRLPGPWGETRLARPARRVVSLGYTSQDGLLALGVVPVGLRHWFGDHPYGVWPWAQPLLGEARPVLMRGEVSIETVAGLAPDLIVAAGSGIGRAEHDLLTRVAPVLMQAPGRPVFGSPWPEDLRRLGLALGRAARAEALIAQVEDAFAALRARRPDWRGRSAVAAWRNGGETGAFMPADSRARFLADLGFRAPEALSRLPAPGGFYATLSPEDLSPLDADVLVWISSFDRAPDLAALPMRRTLVAHREGREVFAGPLVAGALSFGSVLSLPYALRALEPEIAAALDGRPGTPVPSAVRAGLAP
ncbi:MAG: ABC transporter substrate-binding protein [Pseudomonadota bacterium]|nr:ABC transporter substrate-binding protein [Pseudomonadota bacterium]